MSLPFQVTKNITLLGTEFFNLYLVKGETYAIIEGGVRGITYPFLEQLKQLDVPPEAISHLIILSSYHSSFPFRSHDGLSHSQRKISLDENCFF